ncbi:MAG: GIY-YIG nuclease family protein [Chitinophagaceae bacterium]
MEWYLYILYSPILDRYYVGYTGDELAERLRRHNSKHRGFTGTAGDWRIVYTESFPDKLSAHQRELDIKRWKSRKKIEQLIGAQHSG